MIEFYHDNGLMPDRFYYQLNGKSAQENYANQRSKKQENYDLNDDLAASLK